MNDKPALPKHLPTTAAAAFPRPHIKADDLPKSGVTVIIRCVVFDYLQPRPPKWVLCPLVYFRSAKTGKDTEKYLILNKTQADGISEIAGSPEFKKWEGVTVHLTPADAPNGQKTIAVSPPPAPTTTPPAPAKPADDF